ncbi:FadR/GntR family transcriptional regulator [Rugosimonospora acidiphila]|uniref:FadR/GntR family transcriptional regulator n=1 Tax=Rugosimonospora acidiphila TaxID=556531 RepID=A0ABP9SF88_9ACTN
MARYPGRGLHGQAVHELGGRVVRGEWAPGQTIYPEQLEAELGVSKTVVREALRVLGAKGLVDSRPKRGTFVRERSEWNLLDSDVLQWQLLAGASDNLLADLAELRVIVEPAAARLAARRHTAEDAERLGSALDAMAAAEGDAEAAIAADLDFHRALLNAAHNELLQRMDVVLTNALGARDRLVHQQGDAWADPTPMHAAILERIRARDAEGSAAATLELLASAEADAERVRGQAREPKPGGTQKS